MAESTRLPQLPDVAIQSLLTRCSGSAETKLEFKPNNQSSTQVDCEWLTTFVLFG